VIQFKTVDKLQKIIFYFFCILLFLVPIIIWPFTSEVFEFNKMVSIYVLTTIIIAVWLSRCLVVKKFLFRRTILDIPLLIFIASQLISTIFSMDPRTSWLGYYSRFNGGTISVICYALLYWAFVSNLDRKSALIAIRFWLISAALVSIYGVLEHFGIDKKIWVQDVQSRIFSTLGQPNWLAAWLIALIPITWSFILNSKIRSFKFWIYTGLFILFFWAIIFTKSRSGYLGFAFAFLIFWGLTLWQKKYEIKKFLLPFLIIGFSVLTICLVSGTEYTPSIGNLISHKKVIEQTQTGSTALETGGTESGTIRKIVWKGAIQVWLHHPIFGTGVETFAYSYYLYRPPEHNLTSEWDFIYNKAHNEYLNFAANSGTIGLLSYLILIVFSLSQILKTKNTLNFALLSGYISILVTNFFGFSVVPIQLEFFLFPAIAFALGQDSEKVKKDKAKIETWQKVGIIISCLFTLLLFYTICRYWQADYLYAKGRGYNTIKRPDIATKYLTQAISFEPEEPLYHEELATSYVSLALTLNQQKDTNDANQFADAATSEIEKAESLSPANVILKRTEYGVFANLAAINLDYLINARDTLISAIALAPTDAKLHYYLGLTYARIGQMSLSLKTLAETIALKSDYQEARDAYAIILKAEQTAK